MAEGLGMQRSHYSLMRLVQIISIITTSCLSLNQHAQQSLGSPTIAPGAEAKLARAEKNIRQELTRHHGTMSLAQFMGEFFINLLPQSIVQDALKAQVTNLTFESAPAYFQRGFTVRGTTVLRNTTTIISNHYIIDPEAGFISIHEIEFPSTTKIADIFGEFSYLSSKITTGPLRLIFSRTSYVDMATKTPISPKGINVLTTIQINSPLLDKINNFFNNLRPYIKLKDYNFLHANLFINPLSITSSNLLIALPLEFSVNFQQLAKEKKLPFTSPLIQQVSSAITFLTVEPFKLTIGFSQGIKLDLTIQPEPLELRTHGSISPTMATAGGEIDGMIKPISWLPIDLGNLGLSLEWDFTVLPAALALGIPFTGIGLRGETILGEGINQVNVELSTKVAAQAPINEAIAVGTTSLSGIAKAAKNFMQTTKGKVLSIGGLTETLGTTLSLASKSLPLQIGLFGKANYLPFSATLWMLEQIAQHRGIATPKLSQALSFIRLTDAYILCTPHTIAIASIEKEYEKGIGIAADLQIGKLSGGMEILILPSIPKLAANGWIAKIDKPFLKFYGPGPQDGPAIDISVSIFEKPYAYVYGTLEIPPLGFKSDLKFALTSNGLITSSTKAFLFNTQTSALHILIPFDHFENMRIMFELESQLIKKLRDSIEQHLISFHQKIKGPVVRRAAEILTKTISKSIDIVPSVNVAQIRGEINGKDLAAGKSPKVSIKVIVQLFGKKQKLVLKDIQFNLQDPLKNSAVIAKKILKELITPIR